jgi:hypothetical protein
VSGPAAPKNPHPTPRSQPHAAPTISNRNKRHPPSCYPSPTAASPSQKGEQKANREPLRLETIATRTKQKPQPISNREKEPVFYPHFCSPNTASPSQKGEQKANREALRLETLVTHRKQKTGPTSNREKEALFRAGSGLMIQPGETITNSPSSSRPNAASRTRKPPPNVKNTRSLPSFLSRLKTTPVLWFVGVTESFNRTLLRLKRLAKRMKRVRAVNRPCDCGEIDSARPNNEQGGVPAGPKNAPSRRNESLKNSRGRAAPAAQAAVPNRWRSRPSRASHPGRLDRRSR